MKRALIIIDYVYDFVADDGKLTCGKPGQKIEAYIANLTTEFANNGDFICAARDNHDITDEYNKEAGMFPAHCYEEKGRALFGAVQTALQSTPESQIIAIDKTRYSAFCGTPLDMKLKERNISQIHLVGVCTDICVLHTAVDAYNLGYEIMVHEKGTASFNQAGHDYAISHFENVLAAKVVR